MVRRRLGQLTKDGLRAGVAQARRARHVLRRSPAARHYDEGHVEAPLVELLDDSDLETLNALLPWHSFTADRRGRPFGRPAWSGKRDVPQQIPDRRIELFDQRFGLRGSHVLEVGCFEGIHTIALCDRADRVTGVDARIENVVKTIVRCSMLDRHPTVLTCDLERPEPAVQWLQADLCHHVGVLYHLTDPVRHLRQLGEWIGRGLMLDTHFSAPERADDTYLVAGERFRFQRFGEQRTDPFSGMASHSKWLLLDDITSVLRRAGFDAVEIVERRDERNGPRVLLFAEKTTSN